MSGALVPAGYAVRCLDTMALLGPRASRAGERVFRALLTRPALYDGLYFAHLRPGGWLASGMDTLAARPLVPALEADLSAQPAEVLVAVFPTGASAAARVRRRHPEVRAVVLCTDVVPHRLWVHPGIDRYLVTSPAAAAAVRRSDPSAAVSVVAPPVDPAFADAPDPLAARAELVLPADRACVLLMGGGWGLGPLTSTAVGLAQAGLSVLAVAGGNRGVEAQLRAVAARMPNVRAFGFTRGVPLLMAAADLVVTVPGATTIAEARVARRPLVLVDAIPGHGRDNIQHELAVGGAAVCNPTAPAVLAAVLAALADTPAPLPEPPNPAAFAQGVLQAITHLEGCRPGT